MNLKFPDDVSYIRSRDPSIANFDWANLRNVRRNLQYTTNVDGDNSSSEGERLQIYLRVKPSSNRGDYLIHNNELLYSVAAKNNEVTHKKIIFSKIFGVESHQKDIFNEIVKIRVLNYLNGEDTSIFTYGATRAGKTYTTIGTAEEPGFLPRTLEYIFKTLPDLPEMSSIKPSSEGKIIKLDSEQRKLELSLKSNILRFQRTTDRSRSMKLYQVMKEKLRNEPFASLEQSSEVILGVWVSFVEISNEDIYDLFQKNVSSINDRKKLRIAIVDEKPHIKDLTHICVSNGEEAFQVYLYGIQKLKSLKSNVHNYSSRSHTIFTIKIAHTLANRDTSYVSSFNICDLTGVDGTKKPMDKNQLKEHNSINNSMMVFGMCMNKLEILLRNPGMKKHVIPCRDSKLTQLFHRALSGLEEFCMIININSSKEASEENQNILNFSALTKNIISKETFLEYASAIQFSDFNYIEEELKQMQEAIEERKSWYVTLKNTRSTNYEMEKEDLQKKWEEILDDSKKYFMTKRKYVVEEFEQSYQTELGLLKINLRQKLDKIQRKKLNIEMKQLMEKYSKNEIILKHCKTELSQLTKQFEEITHLSSGIDSRNKLIAEYEKILEEREMDSFLLNEANCGRKNTSNGLDSSSISSIDCGVTQFDELPNSDNEYKQNDSILGISSSIISEESFPEFASSLEFSGTNSVSLNNIEYGQKINETEATKGTETNNEGTFLLNPELETIETGDPINGE